ncbi:MAG TPA: aminoacyl-tRNA hydrolase [Candidatus Binatia bacterium]|nr:aminoacyl-tRNA hydrolase [Candidatus Binatia bacterium]
MKIVVGLGNPGRKYQRTRHNLGFMIIDHIAKQNGVTVKKKFRNALIGEWRADDEKVLLVKPQTYMNRSGESVKDLLREYRVSAEDLIVVYDELDLPFGRIRIRPRGGTAGHRGMLSILESLAGAPFYRVRVGIGRPPEGANPADFILEPFTSQELDQLDEVISRAAGAVVCLLEKGGPKAMEQYNRSA